MKKKASRKLCYTLALAVSIPLLLVEAEDGLAQGAVPLERLDVGLKREILEKALFEVSSSPRTTLDFYRPASEKRAINGFQQVSEESELESSGLDFARLERPVNHSQLPRIFKDLRGKLSSDHWFKQSSTGGLGSLWFRAGGDSKKVAYENYLSMPSPLDSIYDKTINFGADRNNFQKRSVVQSKNLGTKAVATKEIGLLLNQTTRGANYRREVFEADLLSRRAMKYIGQLTLDFMYEAEYGGLIGNSDDWTAPLNQPEESVLACDSGGLIVTTTRTDFRKLRIQIQAERCLSDGWLANGDMVFTLNDALVQEFESPRTSFPMTYSASEFSIQDTDGNSFNYNGGLSCDVAANSPAVSELYTVDKATNSVISYEVIYGSALDDSLRVDFNPLEYNSNEKTNSNLIYAFNCDLSSLNVRHRGKSHQIRGQKVIFDQYDDNALVTVDRATRLAQTDSGAYLFFNDSRGAVTKGFDHADYPIFLFQDARVDFSQSVRAESLVSETEDAFVYGYTYQDRGYHSLWVDEAGFPGASFPGFDGQPLTTNFGLDLNADGENDVSLGGYSSNIYGSNACLWDVIWEEGLGTYIEYQKNEFGSCVPVDYFFANRAGEIIVEDADGDGISDALDDDSDNDGLSDEEEAILGTSPTNPDSDQDGVVDGEDVFPADPLEISDSDGDGVGDYLDDFPNNPDKQAFSDEEILSRIVDPELVRCAEGWRGFNESLYGENGLRDARLLICGGFSEPIGSLEGIQNFKKLEFFLIRDNLDQTNFELLRGKKALNMLWLLGEDNTTISDLSPILEAPLLNLSIRNGGITNQSIRQLGYDSRFGSDAIQNGIVHLIFDFPNQLSLEGSFDDIFPISGLSNLENLSLRSDNFVDLSDLTNMRDITGLVLESARLTNLAGLESLSNLKGFTLYGSKVTSLKPVTNIALESLAVIDAKITDYGDLDELKTLKYLELSGVGLTSLGPLLDGSSEVLNELYLEDNALTDLSPLSEMADLTVLSVKGNPIRDLFGISDLTSLEILNLAETEVSDLSALQNLNLLTLRANGLGLGDISSLENNVNLNEAFLQGNEISDITPLKNLPLQLIDLEDNNIRTVDSGFDGMTNGQIVLYQNPVLCPSLDRLFAQMGNSITVAFDPQDCLADGDDDGLEDSLDAFPSDPGEQLDTDGDAIGNNEDDDDDGDGFLDTDEIEDGYDPLNRFSCPDCFSFDITGTGDVSPLADGLIFIRYLFGFRGDVLLEGAYDGEVTSSIIQELESKIAVSLPALDIDGDGSADPLTDGLLIIRYLFGFSGDALFAGAVSEFSTRSESEMFSYLQALDPGVTSSEPSSIPPSASGWVEGEYGDAFDYDAQCASPRVGSQFSDVQGSVTDENFWIRAYSFDTYLWYDEIEDVDPGTVDSTQIYFDLMKTEALSPSGNPKDKFHFTYDTEDWVRLSQSGVSAGYGVEFFRVRSSPPRQWLVAFTEPNTPAGNAGLQRGWEIAEVDGVDFVSGSDVGTLNAAIFPELGEVHNFVFRDVATGATATFDLEAQEITSTPVQFNKVLAGQGSKIGYLLFNDHIATAEGQLIDAFEEFKSEGITELVLDMRYNGGGFLDIARMVASMVAGTESIGQTFSELKFNDKYPDRNPITGRILSPSNFASSAPGIDSSLQGTILPLLDLNRVVVISGSGTCSASEAVINGLRGVGVEVVLIGDTTCGKPYGFYGIDNCGTTYFTIQFKGVNAIGFGDYTDGFSPPAADSVGVELPGCFVDDDLSRPLGDVSEARLSTALTYLATGSCGNNTSGVQSKPAHPLSNLKGQVVKPEPLSGALMR